MFNAYINLLLYFLKINPWVKNIYEHILALQDCNHIKNFGQGAVYFDWLGTLVGLIAITGNRFMVWGDVEKMGPALAVAMLTILYGYIIKLVTIALTED